MSTRDLAPSHGGSTAQTLPSTPGSGSRPGGAKATRSSSSPALSASTASGLKAAFPDVVPSSLPKNRPPLSHSRDRIHITTHSVQMRFGDDTSAALGALVDEYNRRIDDLTRLEARLVEYESKQPADPQSSTSAEVWQDERRAILRSRNRLQDDNRKLQEENRQLWKVIVTAKGESKDTTKENRDLRSRLDELEGRGGPATARNPTAPQSVGPPSRPVATRALSDGPDNRSQHQVPVHGGDGERRSINGQERRPTSGVKASLDDPQESKGMAGAPVLGLGIADDNSSLPAISARIPSASSVVNLLHQRSVDGFPAQSEGSFPPNVAVSAGAPLRGPKRKASSVDLGKSIKSVDALAAPHMATRAATPPPPASPSMTADQSTATDMNDAARGRLHRTPPSPDVFRPPVASS